MSTMSTNPTSSNPSSAPIDLTGLMNAMLGTQSAAAGLQTATLLSNRDMSNFQTSLIPQTEASTISSAKMTVDAQSNQNRLGAFAIFQNALMAGLGKDVDAFSKTVIS